MPRISAQQRYRNIICVPNDTRQRFVQLEQEASIPMTELGVRLSGIGTFGMNYRVGYRDPSCHLLLLTLEGNGFYNSSHVQFRPKAGELLVSPVGIPMLLGTLKRPWTFLWFYIRGLKRWQHLDGTLPQLSRPVFSTQLHQAMEGLMAETGCLGKQHVLTEAGWVTGEPASFKGSNKAAKLFGELIAEYLQQVLKRSNARIEPWENALRQIWTEVERSPGLDWSQGNICRQLGISAPTLQRLVQRCFDSTPQQMIIAIRMQQARQLLQQSDYPLAIIANEVGYADAYVFSAAFKRFHGISPSSFRTDSGNRNP